MSVESRGEVRELHPEVKAGGDGDTELSCLLEEKTGMCCLGECTEGREAPVCDRAGAVVLLGHSSSTSLVWESSSACKGSCSSRFGTSPESRELGLIHSLHEDLEWRGR